MKKLFSLCVIVALLLVVGYAASQSLTPKPEEFLKWEVVNVLPAEPGVYWIFHKNPDPKSRIKTIVAATTIENKLIEYRYFEGVNVYVFWLDDTEKFVGGLVTGEKRSVCVSCHTHLGQEAS